MNTIRLDNACVKFSSSEKPALQNINYQIKKRDFIILLGSNGSGKSTLLNLLQKQIRPYSGIIHFGREMNQSIAALNQNCSASLFTSLTIYENYLLRRKNPPLKTRHVNERKFLVNYLVDYNPNLSDKLNALVSQLSGGEKQALALALCLLNKPSLLLLDEHTSALDPKTSRQIMHLTQKMISLYGITCVLSTHDMDIALEYGNRILMLNEGKILNTFDHQEKRMLLKEQLIKSYYSDLNASIGSSRAATYAG
jgi:putative tryptophan/tyrosine transport system ATP-binding protein